MKKFVTLFGMLIIAFLFASEFANAGCKGGKRTGFFQQIHERIQERRQSKQSNSCQTQENVTSVSNCTNCSQQSNAVTYVTTENGNQTTSSCPGGICPIVPSNVVPTNYIPAPEPTLPTKPVIRKKASIDVNATIPSEITVITNAQIPVLD